MRKTAPYFTKSQAIISLDQLEKYAEGWLLDGECRLLSKRTLESRRFLVEKLLWFLRRGERVPLGSEDINSYIARTYAKRFYSRAENEVFAGGIENLVGVRE